MKVRLQKYLADAGIASRRRSEELITSGLITVNNKVVTELGTKIDPTEDVVVYKDKVVTLGQDLTYLLLNKPVGYITSVTDPRGRKTVLDLINEKERVFPVGRLDYNSSGLLILTNDGDLTYRLTHPKHHVEKIYDVMVKGTPSEESLKRLRKGVDLGVYKTCECQIKYLGNKQGNTIFEVTLKEGKNRQIRRMFDFIGHPVITLNRVAIGDLKLEALKTGTYRKLTKEEIHYLKSL